MNFNICELPAVKTLGSMFQNTQSFLWDKASSKRRKSSYYQKSTKDHYFGYKDDGKWVHFGYDNGKWDHSNLYLIGRTSTQKCDDIQTSCGLRTSFYTPKGARNDKKVDSTKSTTKLSISSDDGVLIEDTPNISKYWAQRYQLFSKFDDGIKMDEEGWYSVTPEVIAKHQATRCGNGEVVDLFTGVGGNAIQFAQKSKHVTAIDIDPNKIDYAQHNATIYGVENKIDFINTDCLLVAPKLKADTVFMSPPWGGPNYSKVQKFDINTMLKPCGGQTLFNIGKEIAPKIVMYLPRNTDVNQLAELALSTAPPWSLEVENNFLNGRLKAITAYFSKPSFEDGETQSPK